MIFPREKRTHTPGPWEYFQGAICFGSPDERMVLCTPHLHQGTPEEDCILMAAAPDLLRVAELVVQATTGNIPPGIVEEAKRAIRKAKATP